MLIFLAFNPQYFGKRGNLCKTKGLNNRKIFQSTSLSLMLMDRNLFNFFPWTRGIFVTFWYIHDPKFHRLPSSWVFAFFISIWWKRSLFSHFHINWNYNNTAPSSLKQNFVETEFIGKATCEKKNHRSSPVFPSPKQNLNLFLMILNIRVRTILIINKKGLNGKRGKETGKKLRS